ncbi:hypothetical protein ACFVAF_23040 [Streptomyces sp. NPDC057596]|uniref:sensor histidine kinase n=1 Tax=Streptomyces sp. NPDC057596 TaxID=3346178 RepID=UPI00369E17C5
MLRFIASVGEPLNPEVVLWGRDVLGLPAHGNWWQIETGCVVITNLVACSVKPGSTGRSPPGMLALHVVPADGLTHADPTALAAQRTLVESLGGTYHQTTGESVGAAADAAARHTHQAVRATWEARVLNRLATAMMHGQDLPSLVEQVRESFGLTDVSLLERAPEATPGPRWYVVASAGAHPPEQPYEADVESPVSDTLTLATRGVLTTDDQRILGACAAQLGMAHLHGSLARHAAETDTFADAERTRASLIRAADRDLRERLCAAEAALARQDMDTARTSVRRAAQVVADLADLDRLQGGALDLYLRPVGLDELLTAVPDDLGPGGRTIQVRLPEQAPDVIADGALLTRVLTALAADALIHSPAGRPPTLTAEAFDGRLRIRLTGGADGAQRADSLTLRLSQDLTEAMGGTLEPTYDDGRLFSVTLTLPAAAIHS